MPIRRRRTVLRGSSPPPAWRGVLLWMLLPIGGLAIGGGTAWVAQHLTPHASPPPQVVVAMTPPPEGSYATVAPSTPLPEKLRFSTAKPAQLTPAPTVPPTPEPATPRPRPSVATPEQTATEPALPEPTPYTAAAQPVSPATNAATAAAATVPAYPTPTPTPSIALVAEQFVREYLSALNRGDQATAYAYLGGKPGDNGIVAREAPLAKGGSLRVLSLRATPDGTSSAVVHARLESQGLRYRATYYVEPFIDGPHELVIEHVDLRQE